MTSRFEYTESGNIIDHEPNQPRATTFEEERDVAKKDNATVGKFIALVAGLATLYQIIKSLLQ